MPYINGQFVPATFSNNIGQVSPVTGLSSGLGNPLSLYQRQVPQSTNQNDTQTLISFYEEASPLYVEYKNAQKNNDVKKTIELNGKLKEIQQKYNISDSDYGNIVNQMDTAIGSNLSSPTAAANLKSKLVSEALDMGLQAVKTGTSIWQINKARRELARLKRPSAPEPTRLRELDSQIQSLQQKAAGRFPQREQQRQRDYAESLASAQRTAAQYGIPGSSFQQASQIEASKARSQDRLSDEGLKLQYQSMANNLLNLKAREQARVDVMNQAQYLQADLPLFQQQQQAANVLQQTGYENLFGTLEGIPQRVPQLGQTYGQLRQYMDYVNNQPKNIYNLPQNTL